MKFPTILLGGLILAGASVAQSQVLSLRFAPHASCPDGLPGCWAGIHDTITLVPTLGVKMVPDFSCWMVDGTAKDGKLPDLEGLTKVIAHAGPFYSLRGIEVKIKGQLSRKPDGLYLTFPDKTIVKLVPATTSHEVNPTTRIERKPTEAEKSAYENLLKSDQTSAIVTGWMVPKKPNETRQIAVTKFSLSS